MKARKRVLIQIDETLHRKVKARAAMLGMQMSEWIRGVLIEALKEEKGE